MLQSHKDGYIRGHKAMTPEGKVKENVKRQLKKLGAYYFSPMTGGYGSSGVPDIVGCYKGFFFGIECKAGSNKPTALQENNLNKIQSSGGVALVINEHNTDTVTTTLRGLESPE